MRKTSPYSQVFKLARVGTIAGVLLLSACATTMNSNDKQGGKGSFRVEQDGRPATGSRVSWVAGNWQELSEAINAANTANLAIEVNQVHDGSLRVLLPAADVFVGNSLKINRKSQAFLNKIVDEMNARQELRVRIVGHTDSSGNDLQNQILSLNRSNSIANFFINKGLRSSRIELEGRGAIDPLVSNDSPQNRMINRRIELYLYRLK
ncbi:Peptidoglycan-associated lipoprotein [Oligella sp. MSHR50489EDL]|uniref:OmpA family protein n=1 Tax=Oligella sp. MSHR50489EDL TaxID=3139409 RepID=UPI003D818DA4